MPTVPAKSLSTLRPPENGPGPDALAASSPAGGGGPDFRMIELLFFAYREFTADADELLARYAFGRAHHRVLHFVSRAPGMTIADILELLQITKQSLSRVLRQLIEKGFVEQRPGTRDKRQRRLYPTAHGRAFVDELSLQQARRIEAALGPLDAEGREAVARFLRAMAGDGGSARAWLEDAHGSASP